MPLKPRIAMSHNTAVFLVVIIAMLLIFGGSYLYTKWFTYNMWIGVAKNIFTGILVYKVFVKVRFAARR